MFMSFANVLNEEELKIINTMISEAEFVDGKITAGWSAQQVKNNTQLKTTSSSGEKVATIIQKALERHTLLQLMALPKIIRFPLISRYTEGMFYGNHVDNAIMNENMGKNLRLRTDLSLTLFLNSPHSYQGGELIIESNAQRQVFKLPAGSMVVYPSFYIHRVEPVTQGVRLVAVTWIQSLIRNPLQREILFDLHNVRSSLAQQHGKTPELDILAKIRSNLLREWAEF